mmetsp:Transcript_100695/g.215835  ORF Transcript_100695/g.215835 Transcript_100695/m.215835 type:complete len:97 (-) Transcript_100695:1053-1343(-)
MKLAPAAEARTPPTVHQETRWTRPETPPLGSPVAGLEAASCQRGLEAAGLEEAFGREGDHEADRCEAASGRQVGQAGHEVGQEAGQEEACQEAAVQ